MGCVELPIGSLFLPHGGERIHSDSETPAGEIESRASEHLVNNKGGALKAPPLLYCVFPQAVFGHFKYSPENRLEDIKISIG